MGDMEDADEVVDMDNMDMDAIVDMDRERSESVPSTPARATAPSCLLYDHRAWRRCHFSAPGPSISWSSQRSVRSHHQNSTSGPENVLRMRLRLPTRYHEAHCDQSHQTKTLSPRAALAVFFLSDTDCPSSSSPRDHIHLRFRFPLSPLYST